MTASSKTCAAPTPHKGHAQEKHIVDVLIEERATKLMHSPLWPLLKRILYPMLLYRQAVELTDQVSPLPGGAVFDEVSQLLQLDVKTNGIENIPKTGRVLIASTHPTGISDGIAMYDALKERRPDMIFFANRDAIRAAPGLEDVIIPVEWVEEKRSRLRSRETLAGAIRAFNDERCVVIFPSGRLAAMGPHKVLIEQDWLSSVAIFARKYDCPLVPAHIEMRNSSLYYLFWKLNEELRDITLFHELLNKKGKHFDMTFGTLIPQDALQGEAADVAEALRQHAMHNVVAGRPWRPLT